MKTTTTSALSRFERLAVGLGKWTNERPAIKALQGIYQRRFGQYWTWACIHNLVHIEGLDIATSLAPSRGVLLCANHRSFFDQYIISLILVRNVPWVRDLYFPVRSNFFYESWAGLAVNYFVGGGVMYPPIFRDPAKAPFNKEALETVSRFLDKPGALVGLHPEGTRGKGPDPYALLPAQPGVGMVALRAKPTILPVWINGLSNDFLGQVASNYRSGEKRGEPIIVVFGKPVELGALAEGRPRPAQYKRVADHILGDIRKLGQQERVLRAELTGRTQIAF